MLTSFQILRRLNKIKREIAMDDSGTLERAFAVMLKQSYNSFEHQDKICGVTDERNGHLTIFMAGADASLHNSLNFSEGLEFWADVLERC